MVSTTLMRLAVVPGIVIIVYIYTRDKVEKEPISLILKLILFGAACCYLAAFAENIVGNLLPGYQPGSAQYAVTTAFLVAGFWEELVKNLALRLGSWRHTSFNYMFDGIVYGVSVAVGFAVLENVMYVTQYGFATAVVRAFTAVPLHAFCGAVMGIFYSYAKRASVHNQPVSGMFYSFMSWFVPVLIHGIYDTFAMMNSTVASTMLWVFVAFLYYTITKMVKKMSAEDRSIGGFHL